VPFCQPKDGKLCEEASEVGYYVREDSAHENFADEIALSRA
jgi:hypothetical protein